MFRASGSNGKVPSIISQLNTGWLVSSQNSSADQAFQILLLVTIPGGTMGPSSRLIITHDWHVTSSATTKFMAIDFGGTNVAGPSSTTNVEGGFRTEIINLGSLSSQSTLNNTTFGLTAGGRLTSAINTANDVVITFKAKWSAAILADSITLLGYSIEHRPGV